jgi:hypothetical protein
MNLENEPQNIQSILEKAIERAITDLILAQQKGFDRRHRDVLVWKACFDLQQTMEKINETKNNADRD